jgi:hypothetical protein
VVELNLGYYKKTDNANLNILCEFLFIYYSEQLQKFNKNHGGSGFGEMLYDKYMKVAADKDRIERVSNMELYQAKSQVKYLSENDVEFLWDQFKEETAINMLSKNKYSLEEISEATNLTIERMKTLKKRLDRSE